MPLLTDEGRSIRRQAARAIGSRFALVREDRLPAFLEALKKCAKEGPDDVSFVAHRAVGLLTRDFKSPAFSVSPNGQWVLFEERRLPMVADVQLKHPQLLALLHPDEDIRTDSWDSEVRLGQIEDLKRMPRLVKLMVTNEPVKSLFRPRWNSRGDAVALSPTIQSKFYQPIAIWRASDGAVRTWGVPSFKKLYGKRFPNWSTTTDFVEWRGRKAVIHLYDCDNGAGPEEPYDPKGILVYVNVDTWEIGVEK